MTKNAPVPVSPRVVALAYGGLCLFEFSIVVEIFGLPRPEMGENWYRFQTASLELGGLNATAGVTVKTEGNIDLLEEADTIIIPGWRGNDQPVPETLCHALQRAHQRGARLVSICSGVFVLAAAGLLNGREATTHWRYAHQLATDYPAIRVRPDVLYIDNGGILTSAGSAAGIDLCLHLVRNDFGTAAANIVARRLVIQPWRSGGQAQYIERAMVRPHEHDRFAPLFDYLLLNLDKPHTISTMAHHISLSERTFLRRFISATGITPARWLVNARLKQCCELLEHTQDDIERIAGKTGFGTAATLRHHFKKILLTTPMAYRRSFTGSS